MRLPGDGGARLALAAALIVGTILPGALGSTIAAFTDGHSVGGNALTTAANFGPDPISFVGRAQSLSATVTLPSFAPGDLGLVFAFRAGSATPPSLPAGWTNVDGSGATGSTSNSARVGYRVLQAADLTTGIWANATAIQVVVLRGQDPYTPIGGFALDAAVGNQLAYGAVSLQNTSGSSWVVGFGGHRAASDVYFQTVAGMTHRSSFVNNLGLHTAEGVSAFPAVNYDSTVNGSNGWRTYAVEVIPHLGLQRVAVGVSGKLATSRDGVTWTERTSSFGTTTINGVSFGGGQFVAVGNDGTLATSHDGVTWTQRTSSFGTFDNNILGVAYGDGQHVAVGGSGRIATSPDGITWTQRSSGFGGSVMRGVGYGGGLHVAVAQNGKIGTSPDGIDWTQRTSGLRDDAVIVSVAYGGGKYVVAGFIGALATSPDGITWTPQTGFGSGSILGVTYAAAQFVAVGSSGRIATSPDGITWTQRTSGFGTSTIRGITHGSGLYVAVGDSGKVATSPDGVTWTQHTSSFGTSQILAITTGAP